LIDRHFASEKIELNCVAEVEHFDNVKELLKAGMGIGIRPTWIVEEELRSELGALSVLDAGLCAEAGVFCAGAVAPLTQSKAAFEFSARRL
jgi:DNA-binding transcriptional LysR family regulator